MPLPTDDLPIIVQLIMVEQDAVVLVAMGAQLRRDVPPALPRVAASMTATSAARSISPGVAGPVDCAWPCAALCVRTLRANG